MPTAVLLLSLVLALTAGCAARSAGIDSVPEPGAAWAAVMALDVGQLVEVRERDDSRLVGRLQHAHADGVELAADDGGTLARARPDVVRVTAIFEDRRDSLWNGAWIGAGVGTGYAAVVLAGRASAGDDHPTVGQSARSLALGAAIGAGVGALIDIARHRPDRRVIYSAP